KYSLIVSFHNSNIMYLLFFYMNPPLYIFLFFFYLSPAPSPLHSFPTRRSSDLPSTNCVVKSAITKRAASSNLAGSGSGPPRKLRSEEHTSELQSRGHLVCRLLLEKKKKKKKKNNSKYSRQM